MKVQAQDGGGKCYSALLTGGHATSWLCSWNKGVFVLYFCRDETLPKELQSTQGSILQLECTQKFNKNNLICDIREHLYVIIHNTS